MRMSLPELELYDISCLFFIFYFYLCTMMLYGVTDHMKSNTAGEFVIDTPSKLKGKLEMVISSDHEKLFFPLVILDT